MKTGDSINIIFNVLSVIGVEAMVATSALQFGIRFLSEGARGHGEFLIMIMELCSSAVMFALFTTNGSELAAKCLRTAKSNQRMRYASRLYSRASPVSQ